MGDLEFEVIGEMRKVRKLRPMEEDNFSINKLDTLMGAFNSIMGVVLGLGLLVTSIALFVGGIGVMNIMFVSVTERTREIGIRKAIGAKRHSILLQFLFEAAVICMLGGFIGIVLASILTAVINANTDASHYFDAHTRDRRIYISAGRRSCWFCTGIQRRSVGSYRGSSL